MFLVSGKSYEPGPFGLTYFEASGSLPLSLNPFDWLSKALPLLSILGLYSPGPKGLDFCSIFLGDLPKFE